MNPIPSDFTSAISRSSLSRVAAIAALCASTAVVAGETERPRQSNSLRQIVVGGTTSAVQSKGATNGSRTGGRSLQVVGRFVFEPISISNELTGVDSIYYEVRDDDTVGHSVLWSGHTDANGYFDTGVRDISGDDSEPDLYIYFETNSPVVTVERGDALRENYSWDSLDSHLVDDFEGTFYDFGTYAPADSGVGSNVPALNAFHIITRAHRFIQQSTTIDMTKVNVLWPSGDDFEYDYDGEIELGEFIFLSHQVLHLYAHHLERSVGMAVSANNACSNDCRYCESGGANCNTPAECSWCPMTQSIARSEGFADWFPTAANRYFEAGYTFDSGEPFKMLVGANHEFFPPEIIPDDPFDDYSDLSEIREFCGADVEENADRIIYAVASFLEDIADDRRDDHAGNGLHDCYAMGDWAVLRAYLLDKPANVVDMIDQLIQENPSDLPELYSVANNLSPLYAARFPVDTDPPGVVLLVNSPTHPDGQGHTLPCITTEWGSPLDDVTGACGYSYTWWTDPEGLPADNIQDFVNSCVYRTDGPFNVGEHYLTIRAVDCAGHWATQDRTFGPFEVLDCNHNGNVDLCDISCSHSGYEECDVAPAFCNIEGCGLSSDCNDNLAPDECDIADGTSEDCNLNGIPDECEEMGHWGGVTGSWHDGGLWEELTVPGDGYHICVEEMPGDIIAVYAEGTREIATLSCSESLTLESRSHPAAHAYLTVNEGGFVNGDLNLRKVWPDARLTTFDTFTIGGLLTLDGGTLDGPGNVIANGGLRVVRGSRIEGKLVELYGKSESSDRILIGGDAVIHNKSGAVWSVLANAAFNDDFIAQTGGTLVNDGTIRVQLGTKRSVTSCPIDNAGTFHIDSGTLTWTGTTTSTGAVIGDPGTVFELSCGGKDFLPGSSILVDRMRFTGGNCGEVFIAGTYDVTNETTKISGSTITFTDQANIINYGPNFSMTGAVNFNAPIGDTIHFNNFTGGSARFNTDDPLEFVNFTLTNNGRFVNTASITVTGHFDWYAGTWIDGPGEITINGIMTIHPGGAQRGLYRRVMNNAGVAAFRGGIILNHAESKFNNLSTGRMDLLVDGNVVNSGVLNNDGLIVKSDGVGTTTLGTDVLNAGTIEVQTGILKFGRPFTQSEGATVLNGGDVEMLGYLNLPMQIDGGMLTGNGTIITPVPVQNDGGTVAPGFSAGTIVITDDYAQGVNAVFAVEVEGANTGEFDVLEIVGAASLAGELHVFLLDDYVLREGDVFDILTAASITGEFDTVVAPPEAEVFYSATKVRVGFFEPDDFDHDGDTDLPDFANFQLCFGGSNNPPATTCPSGISADLDGDGDVDTVDYASGTPTMNTGPRP